VQKVGTRPVAIRWQSRYLFFLGFCKRLISKAGRVAERFKALVLKYVLNRAYSFHFVQLSPI
jgi:hypothetical protein